ncbi:MAG: N-acetylmuramoyl-L-alanine amidase [Thermomicrobiales bacterium]
MNEPGFSRRVVLRAAAGLAAFAAGASSVRPVAVAAQEAGGTRAGRWTPEVSIDAKAGETDTAGFRSFTADYPFYALGASWDGDVGTWPVIEVETSVDGTTWSDTQQLVAATTDGGRPSREGRLFTALTFADGATQVRFRTVDANGNLGSVDGLSFVYIDASDGPWEYDVTPESAASDAQTDGVDTLVPPKLLTREAWGADESYRFDGTVTWAPEYQEVRHVIIHHTETPTEQDPLVAIRSIYYYHAIEQGWGDIGYNYLVDRNGTIYEGRYGGQNVVGGHSYEYAYGSSGICIIGDYQEHAESDAARAGLVQIAAWTARHLDPLGVEDFHEVPDLPTICAHRDVNATACPGDALYADVPYIRSLVAQTLESGALDSGAPGGIAVRDRVVVQTDDGSALNIRADAGTDAAIVDVLPVGFVAQVVEGPVASGGENWYCLSWDSSTGWTIARYLIVTPPAAVDDGDFDFGANLVLNDSANFRSDNTTTASVIAELQAGDWGYVSEGPIWNDGHTWYRVGTEHLGKGWVAAEFLSSAPIDANPPARYAVGDKVVTNDSANLRPRPGLAQTVAAVLPAGTPMAISVAAYGVTGEVWYGVHGDFGGGWIAEVSLDPAG